MDLESKQKLKKLSNILMKITLIVFVLHFLATKLYWYSDFWWFDMLMHFLGGVFIGILTLYVIFRTHKDIKMSPYIITKLTIISVFVIGFSWEIYEYVVQGFTGAILANPLDSISDLFFDMAGGLYAVYNIDILKNK